MRCENKCPQNYYGVNCSKYCVAQSNCISGHFSCDNNGNLVCEANWIWPNCTKKSIAAIGDPDCPNTLLSDGGCQNGGTCFNYACCCNVGFTGQYCDTRINYCINNLCVNGVCVSTSTGYICNCNQGYTDTYCSTLINPCSSNPCQNQGLCKHINGTFQVNEIIFFHAVLYNYKFFNFILSVYAY